MKRTILLLSLCALIVSKGISQTSFITTWKTDNSGTSGNTEITIPTNSSYTYNYDVDWDNDGVFDEFGLTGNVTHNFGTVGTYTIRIQGDFPAIYFNASGDYNKIISIDQWGTIQWESMQRAFTDCEMLLYNATDAPDLSGVSSMKEMFSGAIIFDGDLSAWDVSNVQDFSYMFNATLFNNDVSSWDMSSATTLKYMFGYSPFNQDISSWDVSHVEDISHMFQGAEFFNQDISSWNVSSVTIMQETFNDANSFDQNLGSWNITNCTMMLDIFSDCHLSISNYDSTLIGWASQSPSAIDLGYASCSYCYGEDARNTLINDFSWIISDDGKDCSPYNYFVTTWITNIPGSSGGTEITIPTHSAYTYNYDVDWNNDGIFDEFGITGNITHNFGAAGIYTIQIKGQFPAMYFNNSGDKNKIVSVDKWGNIAWESFASAFSSCSNLVINATDAPDLSNVTDMSLAFMATYLSTSDLSAWDVSTISNMSGMFMSSGVPSGLDNWDVSGVTNMSNMFSSATPLNNDFSAWDVANVINFENMFSDTDDYMGDLSSWNVSSGENFTSMFESASDFDQDLSAWNITGASSMSYMLSSSGLSTHNYDKILNGWANQTVNSGVSLGVSGITYCQSAYDRAILVNTYAWNIYDGGQACNDTDYFITTWKTDNSGSSNTTSIHIPTNDTQDYNYDVDWNNDGVFDTLGVTGAITHDYGTTGQYQVAIRGTFPAVCFNNESDRMKLISIDQWGSLGWQTMEKAFYGCQNMLCNATDVPNLSNVSNLSGMFRRCNSFNGDISDWDVSSISNMSEMFYESTAFNADISSWNVSQVTDMSGMFNSAYVFNADISNWDVSNVKNMAYMFYYAFAFNQDIGHWEVDSVTSLSRTFTTATEFDQDLSQWNISNVTTMKEIFYVSGLSTENYDKLLQGWSAQDVQDTIDFGAVGVGYCHSGNYRDSLIEKYSWSFTDNGQVCEETDYFVTTWQTNPNAEVDSTITIPTYGAYTYNYDVDWDNDGIFDTLGVSGDFTHTFDSIGTYTIQIKGIFPGMYFNNTGDKEKLRSIEQWGSVWWHSMERAFKGCSNLICNATDVPDVSYVTLMDEAFLSATLFNPNPNGWDVSNLTSAENIFNGSGLSNSNYDNLLSGWASQLVQTAVPLGTINNSYCMGAYGHDVLTGTYGWSVSDLGKSCGDSDYFVSTWRTDSSGVSNDSTIIIPTNSAYNYFYDVDWNNDGVFDTLGITGDYEHTFDAVGTYTIRIRGAFPSIYFDNEGDKEKLISIDQWGAIQWQSMESSFKGCSNLNIAATDAPDLSEVTTMEECFQYCTTLNANLNNWDVSNIVDMYEAFEEATSFNGDISSWDVSSVIDMGDMFEEATSLNQDLNNWDVSSVEKMSDMFKDATSFNGDISSWDVSTVTNMGEMFKSTSSFNGNLSAWNVSNVTDMTDMFKYASSFNQNLGVWDISSVTSMDYIFHNSGITSSTYDAILNGWAQQNVQSGVDLLNLEISYCHAALSRDALINLMGWNISDAGQGCTDTDYFITTWVTDDNQITIPTSGGGYSYDLVWTNLTNPGTNEGFAIGETGDYTITGLSNDDTYQVKISGDFPRIYFNDGGDKAKIQSIEQWGSISWTSMNAAFYGCSNLAYNATDNPDLSSVTDLTSMFQDCSSMLGNSSIDNWDVSTIEDFSRLFWNASTFNAPLNNWDVSSGTNFGRTFNQARAFNQPLDNWNTTSATNMQAMFREADDFNQSLGNWDVNGVTSMYEMFYLATAFNQDLNNWDMSTVTNTVRMFNGTPFNQPLDNWTTFAPLNLRAMFQNSTFNQSLAAFDLSNVTNMLDILDGSAIDITNYDASLIAWAAQTLNSDIDLGTVPSAYCLATTARNTLTSTYNWSISDDGLEADAPEPDVAILEDIIAECEVTSLTAPTATDCIGSITGTHNTSLPITTQGITVVTWEYNDGHGNISTQTQNIVLTDLTAPVPDITVLSDITDECSVSTLIPPTGTDACSDTVYVSHNATLPIANQGTNVVTWTYDDGHGNIATQTQNIIIEDLSAPVPDLNILPDITAECELTTLMAPTATDCYGTIEGEHELSLPITDQGITVVIWYYEDEYGNTSTQTQNIIISDVTAPVADAGTLVDIVDECEVIDLVAPTATDNCEGTITGVHDAIFPITNSTTVTWTYTDGVGNASTQTQEVVIEDNILPSIVCVSDIIIEENNDGYYQVQGVEFDPLNYEDNCSVFSVVNDYNNSATLVGEQLSVGTHNITWVVTDAAGNSNSCTHEIIVSSSVGIGFVANQELSLYPNPAAEYIILKGLDKKEAAVQIYDLSGKLVYQTISNVDFKIDVSDFKAGIYSVRLKNSNQIQTLKFVKIEQ